MWLKENSDWNSGSIEGLKVRGHNYLIDKKKVEATIPVFTIFKCWYGKCPYHLSIDKAILIINLIISKTETISFCFKDNSKMNKSYSSDLLKNVDKNIIVDRLKLIPRLIEAPWVIKKAIDEVPVLVNKHLDTTYFHPRPSSSGFTSNIIDIKVTAGKISKTIASMCSMYKKNIIVELAFLFEGREENSLPEELLGVILINKLGKE